MTHRITRSPEDAAIDDAVMTELGAYARLLDKLPGRITAPGDGIGSVLREVEKLVACYPTGMIPQPVKSLKATAFHFHDRSVKTLGESRALYFRKASYDIYAIALGHSCPKTFGRYYHQRKHFRINPFEWTVFT